MEGAGIVIDAIDYFADNMRVALHEMSREKNLYVIATPATGFGTLVMSFSPDSSNAIRN